METYMKINMYIYALAYIYMLVFREREGGSDKQLVSRVLLIATFH